MQNTNHHGGVPGTNTPNKKAPAAANCIGLHTNTISADYRSTDESGKAIATQIARLALAGHAVHKGQSGDFTVTKWGQARYCQDFAALVHFAQKVGA